MERSVKNRVESVAKSYAERFEAYIKYSRMSDEELVQLAETIANSNVLSVPHADLVFSILAERGYQYRITFVRV